MEVSMKILKILFTTLLIGCGGNDSPKESSSHFGQSDGVWKFMTETGCKTGDEVVGKPVTPATLENWGCTLMQEQGPRKMYDCSQVPDMQKFFVMTQEKC